MPAVVDDVIRCAAEGGLGVGGQAEVGVFHYQITTLVDGDDVAVTSELATQLDAIYATVASIRKTTVGIANYSFHNVDQDLILPDQTAVDAPTATDELLPTQVAALVLGRTATPRTQGRKYVGGITETSSDNGGAWATAAKTALDNFGSKYIEEFTGVSGNVYTPGVLTYLPAPAANIFHSFTSSKTMPSSRTQRRRTRREAFA